jgi:hypothetical protein
MKGMPAKPSGLQQSADGDFGESKAPVMNPDQTYCRGLNDEQKQAVTADFSPLMIGACKFHLVLWLNVRCLLSCLCRIRQDSNTYCSDRAFSESRCVSGSAACLNSARFRSAEFPNFGDHCTLAFIACQY